MVLVYSRHITARKELPSISVSSKRGTNTEKESKSMRRALYTKVSGKIIREKASEDLFLANPSTTKVLFKKA